MSINIFNILNSSPGNVLIPARDPGAMTGSSFIQANMNIKGAQRERNILNEFQHGNIPDFLRHFVPIADNLLRFSPPHWTNNKSINHYTEDLMPPKSS